MADKLDIKATLVRERVIDVKLSNDPTVSRKQADRAEAAADAAEQTKAETQAISDNAAQYETDAATSAAAASQSETNAANHMGLANGARIGAETAETNASQSESNAATSETNAANSASAASISESNAAQSESNAATSETNAATSESNAADSAALAIAAAPAGMSQADFEAVAEANRRKFVGSGFVEWGKHYVSGSGYKVINQGLWTATDQSNILVFGPAYGGAVTESNSLTEYPILNIDGVLVKLKNIAVSTPTQSNLKLPPAPDGLDKKDGTGRFADLAAAIAAGGTSLNASVIDRQDLAGVEVWHEAIEENDVVLPLGNVQYGANTYEGIALSNTVVAQGYHAFGEWDTATKGFGLKWSTASDADKAIFINRKENNIYRDAETGKLIQVRYRIRSIAGLGAAWDLVEAQKAVGNLTLAFSETSPELRVKPRGQLTSVSDLDSYAGGVVGDFMSDDTFTASIMNGHDKDAGLWGVRAGDIATYAHNGKCYFLPIATVARRNQGAYHPVLNENGTTGFFADGGQAVRDWTHVNVRNLINYVSDCFDLVSLIVGSAAQTVGMIGSPTTYMRPDGKFYDAIYEGDVTDLRLSARRESKQDKLTAAVRKAIAGEMRGAEGAVTTELVSSVIETLSTTGGAVDFSVKSGTGIVIGDFVVIRNGDNVGYGYVYYIDADDVRVTDTRANAFAGNIVSTFPRTQGAVTNTYKVTPNTLESKELLWCEIIGDPANYYSGQTYTNTGASQTVNVSVDDVILNSDGNGTNGLDGHYYRSINVNSSFDLSTLDFSNANEFADLGTTYDGQTWTNDGSSQTVTIVDGDVIYLATTGTGTGAQGHYYRYFGVGGSVDLNSLNYNDTSYSADLGTVYRGQQWTNDGSSQSVAVSNGDVVYNEGGSSHPSTAGIVGNYYERIGGSVTEDLSISGYGGVAWTDLGPDWNESPAAGSWLQDGVPGFPLLTHADTGASLIPDGTSKSFKMSRKVNNVALVISSVDNGITWSTSTSWDTPLESSDNARTATLSDDPVIMIFYTTDAHFTEEAVNAVVDVVGNVFATSTNTKTEGNDLLASLIKKVGTASYAGHFGTSVELTQIPMRGASAEASNNGSFYRDAGGTVWQKIINTAIGLPNPSASPTVKAFAYLTHENGQDQLQIVYKEMVWDVAMDIGDEGVSINPTVTQTYTEGVYYRFNTGSRVGNVYRCMSTYTGLVDSAGFGELENGSIYRTSTMQIYFELWNGNGWGDDNTFNIVDNTDVVTDDNGNLVLVGQARVALNTLTGKDD